MIKFGVISKHIEEQKYGDVLFLQADWVNEYWHDTTWWNRFNDVRVGKYVILDNQHPQTKEHGSIANEIAWNFDEYVDMAIRLDVHEIIVPDVLKDRMRTRRQFYDFTRSPRLKMLQSHGIKLMYVPQGVDDYEWLYEMCAFTLLVDSSIISTIGVPKWLCGHGVNTRHELASFIPDPFEVHFLGIGYGVRELHDNPRVRSWDSSLPTAAAQHGVLLEHESPAMKVDYKPDTPCDYQSFIFANTKYIERLLEPEVLKDEV